MLIVRDGLSSVLASEPDIEVVGTTDDGGEAIILVRKYRPDVVLTGLDLHGMPGSELTVRLGAEMLDRPPKVVVFSLVNGDESVTDALRHGAIGALTGEAAREEVIATVRAAAGGQMMLAPEVTRLLADWFRTQTVLSGTQQAYRAMTALTTLTEREQQVLVLIAQGKSTEDVAGELYIGTSTVRTYVYRLRTKLALKDRAQLVSFAYRTGLMAPTGHG
jgi:DNA-binding NarL/FixJ family response regulator